MASCRARPRSSSICREALTVMLALPRFFSAGTESTAITGTSTTDDATSAWHRLTAATFDQAMPQITAIAAIESQTESTMPAVEPTTSKMR